MGYVCLKESGFPANQAINLKKSLELPLSVSIEAEWKTELSNYELTAYTHPSSNSFAEALTSRTSALYWEIGS